MDESFLAVDRAVRLNDRRISTDRGRQSVVRGGSAARSGYRCTAARGQSIFERIEITSPLVATGTLSGLTYVRRLESWRKAGYRVEIVFSRLKSTQLALRRVAARVRQGGHDVPRQDVVRRYARGWQNFQSVYRPLADSWAICENLGQSPQLLERQP